MTQSAAACSNYRRMHPVSSSCIPMRTKITFGFGRGREGRERGSMQVERGQNFRSTQGRLNKSRAPTPPASRRNSLDRVRIVVNYKKGGLNCTSNGACTRTPRNNHACVYASVCNTYTRRRCIGIMPSKSQFLCHKEISIIRKEIIFNVSNLYIKLHLNQFEYSASFIC